MKGRTYLRLGRVSNLPTVWSNTLAGIVLARPPGEPIDAVSAATLAFALSLFYVGGMFLNDAFDRKIDARERPERPIPSGQISAGEVYAIGFALLGAGLVALALHGAFVRHAYSGRAVISGALLASAIVLYDAWHKGNVLSPLLMGACRVLVYVTAAVAVSGGVARSVTEGGLVLLAYLIGLTYVAKQENLARFRNLWPLFFLGVPLVAAWPRSPSGAALLYGFFAWWVFAAVQWLRKAAGADHSRPPGIVPRVVVRLIAGMSLLDAVLIAEHGGGWPAAVAVFAFASTLLLQRWVAGT